MTEYIKDIFPTYWQIYLIIAVFHCIYCKNHTIYYIIQIYNLVIYVKYIWGIHFYKTHTSKWDFSNWILAENERRVYDAYNAEAEVSKVATSGKVRVVLNWIPSRFLSSLKLFCHKTILKLKF